MTTVFVGNTNISPIIIALILTLLTAITITKGMTEISKLIAKIIPFIAIGFFGLATVAVILNFSYIPTFFREIIISAFDITSLTGGGIGIAIITGIQRGIFSNEAGLGTGAHAAALTHHKNPQEQGYIGVLGIYLTTIIGVTLVAFMIMSTGAHYHTVPTGNGIEFLHFALTQLFGTATSIILPIFIFFFGFSTVVTAYLYGEMNVKFLSNKKVAITGLRIVLLLVVLVASISNPGAIWSLVDTGVGITAVINLFVLLLLRKYVKG
jgi:AGCS family alanine or glycine:cation symporter